MKKYRHYKGNVYKFICVATHSETEEKLVIYENDEGEIFARPYDMFYSEVTVNGQTFPRFAEIK